MFLVKRYWLVRSTHEIFITFIVRNSIAMKCLCSDDSTVISGNSLNARTLFVCLFHLHYNSLSHSLNKSIINMTHWFPKTVGIANLIAFLQKCVQCRKCLTQILHTILLVLISKFNSKIRQIKTFLTKSLTGFLLSPILYSAKM